MDKIRALVFAAFMSLSSCVAYPALAQEVECSTIQWKKFDIESSLNGWQSTELPKEHADKLLSSYNREALEPFDFSRVAHVYIGKNSLNFEAVGIATVDTDGCVFTTGIFDLSTLQRWLSK